MTLILLSIITFMAIAFLVLSDLEIQDLTVLVEAKSSGMPEEQYAPYLLRSLEPARA